MDIESSDDPVEGSADGVGTTMGTDIDRLHAVWRYIGDEAFGLTHLIRYSEGSDVHDRPDAYLEREPDVSGLPVADVVTNLGEIVGPGSDLFRDIAGAFLLSGLWSAFFIPVPSEGGPFEDRALRERLVSYLSCRSVRLLPEGLGRSRMDKFRDIMHSELMDMRTYPCVKASGRNCGECGRCLETLWAADANGVLDRYGKTFDLRSYRKRRRSYLFRLLESDETEFLRDIKDRMRESGDGGYREASSASAEIESVIHSTKIPLSEKLAVMGRYRDESETANRYYARYLFRSPDAKRHSEGIRILKKGASPKDRYMLIDLLKKSRSARERKEAVRICTDMADHDDEAMLILGRMYLEGEAVQKDVQAAICLFEESASRGNAEAGIELASAAMRSGTEEDRAEAYSICAMLSDRGDVRATHLLGRMHLEGKGAPKDVEEAKRLFRISARMGHGPSRTDLVSALMCSPDESDRREAFAVCRSHLAESQGPYAEYLMSILYLKGIGVEADLDESVEHMERSLEEGDRIGYFTNYIFELRGEIKRLNYLRRYVTRYYGLLEMRGSWIGIRSDIKGRPRFPHGLINIFISDGATIGEGCTIYQNVTIGSNRMPGHERNGAPTIGKGVFVGAGANIIGAVKVGDRAVVAAGANVAKDVPPGATVVTRSEILGADKGRWRRRAPIPGRGSEGTTAQHVIGRRRSRRMIGRQVIRTERSWEFDELLAFLRERWDEGVSAPPEELHRQMLIGRYIRLPATALFCVLVYPNRKGVVLTTYPLVTVSTREAEKERRGEAEEALQRYAAYVRSLLEGSDRRSLPASR